MSCYVSPSRARSARRSCASSTARPTREEPFVELAAQPPGVRAVRETNLCRISVHVDTRTGRVIAFGAIDNLWKGAASQAVQNLNLMFGRPEGEGIA